MSDNTENTNESPQENAMRVALCASRHPIPDVHDAIFPQVVENPLDFGAHYAHTDAWIDENADFLVVPSNKLYIYVEILERVFKRQKSHRITKNIMVSNFVFYNINSET